MAELCIDTSENVLVSFLVVAESPKIAAIKGAELVLSLLDRKKEVFTGRRNNGNYGFIMSCSLGKINQSIEEVKKLAELKGLRVEEEDKCVLYKKTETTKGIPVEQKKFIF